jgi:hypothetical protein
MSSGNGKGLLVYLLYLEHLTRCFMVSVMLGGAISCPRVVEE